MANVPNTTTFCLTDVTAVVGGQCLTAAITNAGSVGWDAAYCGDKTCLLNFRNYSSAPPISLVTEFCYYGGADCMDGTYILRCCTGAYYSSASISSNNYQCVRFDNIPAGCYYGDFSLVYSHLGGYPIITTYYWSGNMGSGSSCCSNNFGGDSTLCVWIYDGM